MSDLAAVVRIVQPQRIHRVRVINRNQVEVDVCSRHAKVGDWEGRRHFYRYIASDTGPNYVVLDRVLGVWRQTGVGGLTF